MVDVSLPVITEMALPHIQNIIGTLNLPRDVIASDEEIVYAWQNLPRELKLIDPEFRDELLARMCIATSVGLFDSAINYIWNSSIRNLRKKVIVFGLNVVKQILRRDFDETTLNELRDADLLSLCLDLNLISEEGYFFLEQCRDIRNNYSAAHPSIGLINDRELIVFLNRCAKYAISNDVNIQGVDINSFLASIKGSSFNQEQLNTWIERLSKTHEAQRETLLGTLHGIYCDPLSGEEARNNSFLICESLKENFTTALKSNLINRHYDYQAKGDVERHKASTIFFEKLQLINLLNSIEQHSILSSACSGLLSVHKSYDNFYNEYPFAKRLLELSESTQIPESTKQEYVLTVLLCYIGNQYGTSTLASPYYEKMIKRFSPREIKFIFSLPKENLLLKSRIKTYSRCLNQFYKAVELLDERSVPETVKADYSKIMEKTKPV